MITIRHTQNAAAWWAYYLADPALSAEERRGVWYGRACETLGWRSGGLVDGEEFACLLDGYTLDRRSCVLQRLPNRRCGYDVVISAPKSVSVAALCWQDSNGRAAIRTAFDEAVLELAEICERLTKRQGGTTRRVPTGAMAAAIFNHHASRYGDPHLHSHLVIGNLTLLRGKWCAVALDTIYKAHMALDRLFMADLVNRIRNAGIKAKLVDGVCELPVAKDICRRLSAGWGKLEYAANRIGITGRRRSALKAVLNDRLRPRKKAPGRSFDTVVAPGEQQQLQRLWQRGRKRPPGQGGGVFTDLELRAALRAIGAPTERNRLEAAAEVASSHVGVQVADLVGTALRPGLLHPGVGEGEFSAARRSLVRRRHELEEASQAEAPVVSLGEAV